MSTIEDEIAEMARRLYRADWNGLLIREEDGRTNDYDRRLLAHLRQQAEALSREQVADFYVTPCGRAYTITKLGTCGQLTDLGWAACMLRKGMLPVCPGSQEVDRPRRCKPNRAHPNQSCVTCGRPLNPERYARAQA